MKATHQGVCDVLADGPLFSQDVAAFFPSSSPRARGPNSVFDLGRLV